MYNYLFDSDALIKLTRAKAMRRICEVFSCYTTSEVKKEVVDEGKKRLYPDADVIAGLIKEKLLMVKEVKSPLIPLSPLGKGEASLLRLRVAIKNSIIVSDDRAFLAVLEEQNLDFLVPVDLIFLGKTMKKISFNDALCYLEGLKVFIRENDYKRIKEELEVK